MKAILKQENLAYYISTADIIRFISENAPMGWNQCCDFVRDNNIVGYEDKAYWQREEVFNEKTAKHYNPEAIKWMKLFFEAHPFIEQLMFVFDD